MGRASTQSSSTHRDDRSGDFSGIYGVHIAGENLPFYGLLRGQQLSVELRD